MPSRLSPNQFKPRNRTTANRASGRPGAQRTRPQRRAWRGLRPRSGGRIRPTSAGGGLSNSDSVFDASRGWRESGVPSVWAHSFSYPSMRKWAPEAQNMILGHGRSRPSRKTASYSVARTPGKASSSTLATTSNCSSRRSDTTGSHSLHSADPRPPRSHHRRPAGEGGARRARRAAPRRQLSLRGRRRSRGRCSGSRSKPSRRSTASTTVPVPGPSADTRRGCITRRATVHGGVCLAVGRRRSTPRATLFVGDTLFAGGDWPDRLARRQPADAPAVDPGGALQFPRRDRRAIRGTASATTIGKEKQTNPFLLARVDFSSPRVSASRPAGRRAPRSTVTSTDGSRPARRCAERSAAAGVSPSTSMQRYNGCISSAVARSSTSR